MGKLGFNYKLTSKCVAFDKCLMFYSGRGRERAKDFECANFANRKRFCFKIHFNWIDLFETDELNNKYRISLTVKTLSHHPVR